MWLEGSTGVDNSIKTWSLLAQSVTCSVRFPRIRISTVLLSCHCFPQYLQATGGIVS